MELSTHKNNHLSLEVRVIMSTNNNEIVHEGWLTKSPPSKRIWKARWRRRWFVLRHSGELPGQFFLQYYKDRNCRKLKGTIDLDQCEQVDAGLRFENSKQNYPHMFDVKTPKRTYYLAADSEADMNKWVDCVCQVCGLKSATDDNSVEFTEENNDSVVATNETPESPPTSPTSTVSGPYIPISECITGKPLNTPLGISDFNNVISQQGRTGFPNANKIISKDPYQALHPLKQNKLNNIKQTICDDDISKCDNNKSVTLVMSMPKTSVDRFNSLYGDKNILTNLNTNKDDVVNTTKITNIESAKKMAEMKNQGRRPPDLKLSEPVSLDFYDCPRKIVVDKAEWSPEDWRQSTAPIPNWETFPNMEIPDETEFSPAEIGSWNVVRKFGKMALVGSKYPITTDSNHPIMTNSNHSIELDANHTIETDSNHPNVTKSLNRVTKHKAQPDTFSLRRPVAPPRPPKPSHLIIQENVHNYLNLEKNNEKVPETSTPNVVPQGQIATSDEMYDIPRSHQPPSEEAPDNSNRASSRHNYLNAAPVEMTGNVFIYDFSETQENNLQVNEVNPGDPVSPRSEGSGSGAIYSNLPSPLNAGLPTPPAVNRELKPTRKMSDSGVSNEPSPGGSFSSSHAKEPSPGGPFSLGGVGELPINGPPSIDRTLKPKKLQTEGALKLGKPPEGSLSLRRVRAGPSPVPQGSSTLPVSIRNGRLRSEYSSSEEDPRRSPDNEPIYYFESSNNRYIPAGKKSPEIQYIDLDLDSDISTVNAGSGAQTVEPTTTVYKTVDFLKTEAFNRTRQEVEEERNKLPAE